MAVQTVKKHSIAYHVIKLKRLTKQIELEQKINKDRAHAMLKMGAIK